MKRIGILFGGENSFPGALVEQINARNIDGIAGRVCADRRGAARPGAALLGDCGPHLARHSLLPRLSEARRAATEPWSSTILSGASADDKFFNYALAAKLGVAVPADRDAAP